MNDLSLTRLWLMRGGFLLIALVILFFHLLPLDTSPRRWAGPDLILCFALAWSVRRPEYVPPLVLAGVFLLSDLLLQRPPGLWALLALLGCERIKMRARGLRDSTFPAEWLTAATIIFVILVSNRLILAVLFVELPGITLSLFELGMTVLFYPVVVLITHSLMGVRKAAPGELDALGQRA